MTIEDQIKQYVAENFLFSDDGYTLPEEASFLEEGIVDSLCRGDIRCHCRQ